MIDAKLLATYDAESGEVLYLLGGWFPRKGDNLRLTMEVVHNYFAILGAEVVEKNYEDVGDGSSAAVTVTFDQVTGRQTMEVLGCKELVRVKISLARGLDLPPGEVGTVLFRLLRPVWFEAVKV